MMTNKELLIGLGGVVLGTAIGAFVYHQIVKDDLEELEELRANKEDVEAMRKDYSQKLKDTIDFYDTCVKIKEVNDEYEAYKEAASQYTDEEPDDIVEDYFEDGESHSDFMSSYYERIEDADNKIVESKDFCIKHGINPIFAKVVNRYLTSEREDKVRNEYGYTNDMYPEVITKDQYINSEAPNDSHEDDPAILDCIIYPHEGIIMDTATNEEIDFAEGFISMYNLKEFGDNVPGYLFTYSYYFNVYCMCRLAGEGAHYRGPSVSSKYVGEDGKGINILQDWEPKFIDPDEWLDRDGQEPVTLDYYQEDGIWADERGYVMPCSWTPEKAFGPEITKALNVRVDADTCEYRYIRCLRSHTDYEVCVNGCAYDESDYIRD